MHEQLRAVGVLSSVGHAQYAWLVLELEVLVVKSITIDALTTSAKMCWLGMQLQAQCWGVPIAVGKVSSL